MLPNYIVSYLKSIKNIKSKTVGILGISFKPENDDIRGSLSIRLLKLLKKNKIKHFFSDEYSKLENDLEKIKLIKISDIIIVATPHMAYKKLKIARNKTIIDLSGHLC